MPKLDRLIRSSCPLCSSSHKADYKSVRQWEEDWHLVTCDDCGFLYVWDCWSDSTIDKTMNGIPAPQPRHHQIARVIRRLVPRYGKVIEIGCGAGEVGFLIRDDYNYVGFDPSSTQTAPSIKAGLNITVGYFTPTGLKADAVVLDNVMEHVIDPAALSKACMRSLKPSGIIVVLVPNRYDARRLIPGWSARHHWRPPEHINYFRRSDVARMFGGMRASAFGLQTLQWPQDRKFYARECLEALGLHLFGHNVVIGPGKSS